jgi:hypothetical protein
LFEFASFRNECFEPAISKRNAGIEMKIIVTDERGRRQTSSPKTRADLLMRVHAREADFGKGDGPGGEVGFNNDLSLGAILVSEFINVLRFRKAAHWLNNVGNAGDEFVNKWTESFRREIPFPTLASDSARHGHAPLRTGPVPSLVCKNPPKVKQRSEGENRAHIRLPAVEHRPRLEAMLSLLIHGRLMTQGSRMPESAGK